MSLLGDLQDLDVFEILQLLGRGEHSGVLSLTWGDRAAKLTLRAGRIISASSNKTPKLGHSLVRRGLLTIKQLKDVIRQQEEIDETVPFGVLLRMSNVISSERLEEELRTQTLQVLAEIQNWSEGAFLFQRDEETCADSGLVDGFDVAMIMLDFMRTRDETRQRVEELFSRPI